MFPITLPNILVSSIRALRREFTWWCSMAPLPGATSSTPPQYFFKKPPRGACAWEPQHALYSTLQCLGLALQGSDTINDALGHCYERPSFVKIASLPLRQVESLLDGVVHLCLLINGQDCLRECGQLVPLLTEPVKRKIFLIHNIYPLHRKANEVTNGC